MNLSSGFVAGMSAGAKRLLSCLLLAVCFTIPAWGGKPDMTVEEFVRKLEEAGDWPRERVETLLGVKFVDRHPGDGRVAGRFVYGKGLIVSGISHSRLRDTHETLSLDVLLSKESSCFTQDRLERLYPGADVEVAPADGLQLVDKKPWGEIVFGFVYEPKAKGDKYCLKSITTETNRSLDIWKERYKNNKK